MCYLVVDLSIGLCVVKVGGQGGVALVAWYFQGAPGWGREGGVLLGPVRSWGGPGGAGAGRGVVTKVLKITNSAEEYI